MSASLNWIAWFAPIGRPNACRSRAYFTDSSTHPCASPVDNAAIAAHQAALIVEQIAALERLTDAQAVALDEKNRLETMVGNCRSWRGFRRDAQKR